MGWNPGNTLGIRNNGLKSPIEPVLLLPRLGLGDHNVNMYKIGTNNVDDNMLQQQIIHSLGLQTDTRAPNAIHIEEKVISSLFEEEVSIDDSKVELFKSEIKVDILGNSVVALVDTGSDVTCISSAFWENSIRKLNEQVPLLPVKAVQIRGAIGQKSSKIQQMVLLPIAFDTVTIETSFLIVPNLVHSVILGFDWLKLNRASIQLISSVESGITIEEHNLFIPFHGVTHDVCTLLVNTVNVKKTKDDSYDFLKNINTGVPLNKTQLSKLRLVLERFGDVFVQKLGKANCYQHEIKMSEHTPFIKRSYPVPYAYRQKMEEKLTEMTEMGIISRASTPYSSPLTFTLKSDGSLRVLLDAREINKYMVAEAEAPPMQLDVLNSFHGVKYISIIDLNNAYFQIPISDDSRKYTGFTFNGRSYIYNVLPQGLKTSVGSFSRAMDLILGPEVRQFCVNYLDDLAILTTGTLDEHLTHISIVLSRLKMAGLTCNIKKCKFICKEVKMLGHIISTEGVRTDPEKIESIQKFPIPKKIKHLRAFLGLCNYYRRFIPNYSTIILPLCDILRKNKTWAWTREAQWAFDQLKKTFLDTIMLHHPDTTKSYYLQTDSSGVGIAGVLYQYNDQGEMKILGYCSKALKGAELRWTVTEQEFWAIIYCLRKFETYLRGAKVMIRTDHKALTFVKTWKLYNSRIIRWILYLEQFNYEVEHVKGKDNIAVDVLSRFPPNSDIVQEDKVQCPTIHYMETKKNKTLLSKLKDILTYQFNDPEVRQILNFINRTDLDNCCHKLGRIARRCYLKNNMLYYKDCMGKDLLYLPKELREEVCWQVHKEMGHQGAFKISKYLRDRFYWLKMNKDIKTILKGCHICQLSKSDNIKYVGKCKSIISGDVGDLVMADLYGPLPKSRFGATYILVIQDSFSKFVKLYDLRKATARAVVTKLKHFTTIIKPKVVMTDNGSQFISMLWRNTLKDMGIKPIYTTVRNPRPNTTERVNKELGRLFRTYCYRNHKGWATLLPSIEKLYNNTYHESIGYTPLEVISGISNTMSFDVCFPKTHNDNNVELIKLKVRRNLQDASEKRQKKFNRSHRLIIFQIGDLVKIKRQNKSDAKLDITKKFQLLYEGPYIVAAVPFANVYTLMNPETKDIRGNFNAIHLSRYY